MNTTTEPTRAQFHINRKIAQAAVDAALDAFRAAAPVTSTLDAPRAFDSRNTANVQMVRIGKGTKKHITDGVRASCGADRQGWNYSELRQAGMTTPNRIRADVTCERCRAMFNA